MLRTLIGPLLIVVFCMRPPLPQQAAADPAAREPAPPAPTALGQEDLSPKQLLDAMAKVYAECRTYQDTGTVTMKIGLKEKGSLAVDLTFKTAFVRPDRFRFEFTDTFPPSQYIVWSKAGNVRTWWSIPSGEKPASLDLAIAAATGVSRGAAHHVPALLMPGEISGWVLTQLADPVRLEDAPLGTRTCHKVKGFIQKHAMTLWLDASTNLVLRIDMEAQLNGSRTETTTSYEPVIDGDVPEALLAFGAPAKANPR